MWEEALTQLIHLNVKKKDLVSKYICCLWFDADSMTCIAKPLFQLSQAPKFSIFHCLLLVKLAAFEIYCF